PTSRMREADTPGRCVDRECEPEVFFVIVASLFVGRNFSPTMWAGFQSGHVGRISIRPRSVGINSDLQRSRWLRRVRTALGYAQTISFRDQLDELARQGNLARQRELSLAAVPIHRQRIVVFVEAEPVALFVGGNHVEILAYELRERVALDV